MEYAHFYYNFLFMLQISSQSKILECFADFFVFLRNFWSQVKGGRGMEGKGRGGGREERGKGEGDDILSVYITCCLVYV